MFVSFYLIAKTDALAFAMQGESFVAQAPRKGCTETKHLSSEELTAIRQAKQTEVQNWVRNSGVEAASKKGIHTRNLMRMAWVSTRKSEGASKVLMVVPGFTDPHLAHLRRGSATASRRARNVFFYTCMCTTET